MFPLDALPQPPVPDSPWPLLWLFPLLAIVLIGAAVVILVLSLRYSRKIRNEAAQRPENGESRRP